MVRSYKMKQVDAKVLLTKYRTGRLSERERVILESWYIEQGKLWPSYILSDEELEEDLLKIFKGLPVDQPSVRNIRSIFARLSIAASILFSISVGLFFYQRNKNTKQNTAAISNKDIPAGNSKAILTLADNTEIVLDDSSLGEIAKQTGITVSKAANGQLKYVVNRDVTVENGPVQYNSISTPRGGEYQVQLSDGTVVWLNSMSSIRFPTSFNGDERRVEITGEAYLEVARNPEKPFRVECKNHVVEVLGTHFNINTYNAHAIEKTTLLEGSVKIITKGGSRSATLRPGQQSQIRPGQPSIDIKEVDPEEAVAWKKGYFLFVEEDLKSIMTSLSRWYDVDVEYQGVAAGSTRFSGSISRKKSLMEVLRILELTENVQCKIVGRRVIIMH